MSDDEAPEHDLTIYPVMADPDTETYREIPELLPQPPFTVACVGMRGSSKSTTLVNLVARPYPFYGAATKVTKDERTHPVFDQIYIISPSLGHDATTKCLLDIVPEENRFEKYDDSIVEQLIEFQKSQPPPRQKILLIADDLLGMGISPTAAIYRLPSLCRHFQISTIFLTQMLRGHHALPPATRVNTEYFLLFKTANAKEIEKTAEEMAMFGSPDNYKNLYYDAVMERPYEFLYLDCKKYKAYHNFGEELWSKYDESGQFSPDYVPKSQAGREAMAAIEGPTSAKPRRSGRKKKLDEE